jgi:hypothetical protein
MKTSKPTAKLQKSRHQVMSLLPAQAVSAGNAVKRSVTVRRDLHDAILSSVGAREYSSFLNEALVMALQAQGIARSVVAFEAEHGELTTEDLREAAWRRTVGTSKTRR